MIYSCSGILVRNNKELNTNTCNNLNGPQKCYVIEKLVANTTYSIIPLTQNVKDRQIYRQKIG